jgi:hypothetical protein
MKICVHYFDTIKFKKFRTNVDALMSLVTCTFPPSSCEQNLPTRHKLHLHNKVTVRGQGRIGCRKIRGHPKDTQSKRSLPICRSNPSLTYFCRLKRFIVHHSRSFSELNGSVSVMKRKKIPFF